MAFISSITKPITQAWNSFDDYTCRLAQATVGRKAHDSISKKEKVLAVAIKCLHVASLCFGILGALAHPLVFSAGFLMGVFLNKNGEMKNSSLAQPKTTFFLLLLSYIPIFGALQLGRQTGQILKAYLPVHLRNYDLASLQH